jgi:HAD superfamily hydrolase (TIGR01549 family)
MRLPWRFEWCQRAKILLVPPVRIDTVFLDAGGVLVWPNWVRIARAFTDAGHPVDARALAAADPFVRKALDDAALVRASTDEGRGWSFFSRVLAEAGVTLSIDTPSSALAEVEAYHRAHNIWEDVPAFVRPALAELRQNGYKLVVVSNANGTLRRVFDRLGLTRLVDVMVDSAEEGFEKPDRRLFEIALARAGAVPDRTVHVGDFYNIDVVGGRAAGLIPVLVDQANLYGDADCARIRSVADLPALMTTL